VRTSKKKRSRSERVEQAFRPALRLLRIGALAPEVFAWGDETPMFLRITSAAKPLLLAAYLRP